VGVKFPTVAIGELLLEYTAEDAKGPEEFDTVENCSMAQQNDPLRREGDERWWDASKPPQQANFALLNLTSDRSGNP